MILGKERRAVRNATRAIRDLMLRPGGVVVGIGQFAMGLDRDAWVQANVNLVPA